jgi:hypothetical protein
MKDLKELIRSDETYSSIQNGKCSKCDEPYALIIGSNKTFYKNGKRYATINSDQNGWASFRCKNCKEVIDETWVAVND